MDYLIKGYWYQADGAQARHQGHQRPGPEGARRQAKKAQFSTAAAVRVVPQLDRSDRRRHHLPDPRRAALQEAARAPSEQGHRRPRSPATTTTTSRSSARPRRATSGSCSPRPRPQATAAMKALQSGPELDRGRQEVLDRPDHQEQRRAAQRRHQGPAGRGAANAAFAAPGQQADRSGQGPVRLLRDRGHEDQAGDAAQPRAVDGPDQADADLDSCRRTAATAVTNQAKKDWQSQTKCRAQYAMADCSGYKAPNDQQRRPPPPRPELARRRRSPRPPPKR